MVQAQRPESETDVPVYVGVDWAGDHVRHGTTRTISGTDQDWREVLEGT